jgi:hypothetical protein
MRGQGLAAAWAGPVDLGVHHARGSDLARSGTLSGPELVEIGCSEGPETAERHQLQTRHLPGSAGARHPGA